MHLISVAAPRRSLDRHAYLFAPAPHTVRDAIYGSVPLSHAAFATLDTAAFQRLRHIKQVGPVFLVYPGATHTRFGHSIGVYHLTRLALQHLTGLADIEPEIGRATLAAALLHDIGHFPYSHVMDEIVVNGSRLSHLELTVELIDTDAELRQVLEGAWEVAPQLVVDLLIGRPNPLIPRFLYTLIDGPMDMDKLDYLNRDAHHTGVPYGRVEVQRLIDFLAVAPGTGDLVITEAGVGTVESVIFAKYLMFRYVYWHHTARIAGAMINRAVLDCLLALGNVEHLSVNDPVLRRVCAATDATLESTLRDLLREAGAAPPPALDLLSRVERRSLFKRAQTVACAVTPLLDECFREALPRRQREAELASLVRDELPVGSPPFFDSDVLIDLPPGAKFAADIRGIALESPDQPLRVVSWEDSPSASYLTTATVAAMEQSLRSALVVCDTHRADGELIRMALSRIQLV